MTNPMGKRIFPAKEAKVPDSANRYFIVSINPAGALTLAGLAVDVAAFLLLLDVPALATGHSFAPALAGENRFFLGISLMYLGMLADAFDGFIARRFRWESEFGRYLDGFVDVFNYLVIPNLALWRLGFHGTSAGALIMLMIACGILRLSKFNMIGNITDKGEKKYLGLPVFWSQLLFVPLYLVFAYASAWFFSACALVWGVMSVAFIINRPFFKPKNPIVMAVILLGLSAIAAAFFLKSLHP